MKIKILFFLLLPLLCLSACAPPQLSDGLTRFDKVGNNIKTSTIIGFGGEEFTVYEDQKIRLAVALFDYKELAFAGIYITNKTRQDIQPDEYSIALSDGRDHLPLKLITRENVEAIRAKGANAGDFNLMSPSVQGAFNTFQSLLSFPSESVLSQNLDKALQNYFAFRPIYAGEKRQGLLAFFHAFELEYPLLFALEIKGEMIYLYFEPRTPS